MEAAIPMGTMAHNMYKMMVANGYKDKDFSSAIQFIQELDNQAAAKKELDDQAAAKKENQDQ